MKFKFANLLILACTALCTHAYAKEPTIVENEALEEQQAELSFLHANGLTFTTIDLSTGLVFLRVNLQGKEIWALLDNGSDTTIIDRSLANNLEIPVSDAEGFVTTTFGRLPTNRTVGAQFQVPQQFKTTANFWSADLASVSSAIGKDIGIVIGADILDKISYIVDPNRSRILFAQSGRLNFNAPNMVKLPVVDGAVEAQINGQKANLRVDLGSTSFLRILENRWSEVFPNTEPAALGKSVDGAGIVNQNIGAKEVVLEISRFRAVGDVEVTRSLGQRGDGYLGVPFFRDKAVLFDYPDGKIVILGR